MDTNNQDTNQPEVIIIGAGLAGLACAVHLHNWKIPFRILEASDGIGGRVRTDSYQGYQLDRGFQIYLTAYPEGQRMLDYQALNLKSFARGAYIRYRGKWHRVSDPREQPLSIFRSLFSPIGTISDKLKFLPFHWSIIHEQNDAIPAANSSVKSESPFATSPHHPPPVSPENSSGSNKEILTLDELRWRGKFSEAMIQRFFQPFFGGVFLESELSTSNRFFRFVYRMFASGVGAIPEKGMQAIPEQLKNRLPIGSIQLNTEISKIEGRTVFTSQGEAISAKAIVVATSGPRAAKLLPEKIDSTNSQLDILKMPTTDHSSNNGYSSNHLFIEDPGSRSNTTLYYAAPKFSFTEPILLLNGDRKGYINSLVDLSAVAPSYAPTGMHLLSISVIGIPPLDDQALDLAIRQQASEWFGQECQAWQLVKIYRIPHALPEKIMRAQNNRIPVKSRLYPGLYICGDYCETASINGALVSGFRAAQAVSEDLDRYKANTSSIN